MNVTYDASAAMLREVWHVLRRPVTPRQSILSQQPVRRIVLRALSASRENSPLVAEEILFHAAGGFELSASARKELLAILGFAPQLTAPAPRRPKDPYDPFPQALMSLCLKLEMLGLNIDSMPIWKTAEAALSECGAGAAPLGAIGTDDRLKQRVGVYGPVSSTAKNVRLLRTHRGFIIRAYFDQLLEPLRLDVFGPQYNGVGEWMDLAGAQGAWLLEFRDAPGYDPEALPELFPATQSGRRRLAS